MKISVCTLVALLLALALAGPAAAGHGELTVSRSPSGPVLAGGEIAVTVEVHNSSTTGIDLFDASVDSAFGDPNLALMPGTVTTRYREIDNPSGTIVSGNGAGDQDFLVELDPVPPGWTAEIRFRMRLAGAVDAGVEEAFTQVALTYCDQICRSVPWLVIVPVVAEPELELLKNDFGAVLVPGGTVTYVIGATNLGSQEATGLLLTDTVPAHTRFVASASDPGWSCAPHDGPGSVCSVTFDRLHVDRSAAYSFTLELDSAPLPAGLESVRNAARVQDDGTNSGGIFQVAVAIEETPVAAAPDLALAKGDGGVTARPGDVVVYALSYENRGDQGATGVVLEESVPLHAVFSSGGSSPGWTCSPGAGPPGATCTLPIGSLGAGGSGAAAFAVRVDDSLPSGVEQLVNAAAIRDDGASGPDPVPGNNQATDTTPLDAVPDLVIEKSDGGERAVPGGTLAYALSYRNVGNQRAAGVVLEETVPAATVFAAGASTAGWSCVPASGAAGAICTLARGGLTAGSSGVATFAVRVDSEVAAGVDQLVNAVAIRDGGGDGADPTPENNRASVTTPLDAAPDLGVAKSDAGVTVRPGESVVYALSYENVGSQAATGAFLRETVPAHAAFAAGASTAGWLCSGGSCTLALGDLAPGESGDALFAVVVDSAIPSGVVELENSVTVGDDGGNGPDLDPANDEASETTPVDAAPDLVVSKEDGGVTARPGEVVSYVLRYRNDGDQGAAGVVLEETVPWHAAWSPGGSSAGWTCAPASGEAGATCTLEVASLAAGSSGEATFAVRVGSVVGASVDELVNTVAIRDGGADGADPTPENNRATTRTPLEAAPDLAVVKGDGGVTARPGETVVYALSFENLGSQTATGVFLQESVPAHTALAAEASTPGWLCSGAGAGSICTLPLGNLAPGEAGSAAFAVVVDAALAAGVDRIENAVTVGDDGGNGPDSDPENDHSAVATPVAAVPDLVVSKEDGGVVARPGEVVSYLIRYGNDGDQAATGVVLEETLPATTGFEAGGSSSGWVCPSPAALAGKLKAERIQEKAGGSVLCTLDLGELPAGGAGSATFAVRVEAPLPAGVEALANTVRIFDDGANGPDPSPADNEASATTPVEAAPDLAVGVSDGDVTARAGDVVVYAIDFTNRGDQGATGVVLEGTVPLHAVFRPAASTPGWVCSAGGAAALDRRLKAERIQSDAEAENAEDGLEADGLRERGGPRRVSGRTAVGGATCTLAVGALAAGAGGSAAFAVAVDDPLPATAGPLETVVRVADDGTNGPDPSPADNVATETTPLELPEDPGPGPDPEPGAVLDLYLVDFLVEDRDDSGSFSAGDVVSYSVDLRNTGTVEAREVVFTLPVPAHTAFVEGSVSGDRPVEPSVADGVLTVRLQDLAAGDVAALAWDVVIDLELPPEVEEIVAQGTVTAAGVDPHPSDDPDTVEPDDPTVTPLEAGGGPVEVQPIPTVSEVGLLLLGLLLALGAWRVLR